MKVPSNMERIPNKIASSFGSFTAEQSKLWTVVYSEFALKKVFAIRRLPNLALVCERLSNINCTSYHYSVSCCGSFLPNGFCKKFESRYRQMQVTPNMHLHSHLLNCVLDYGPVNNFWLFSSGHQGPAISKLIL